MSKLTKSGYSDWEKVCEVLRMGYNAVYELLNEGKLKAYKNGRVWRIPREALESL